MTPAPTNEDKPRPHETRKFMEGLQIKVHPGLMWVFNYYPGAVRQIMRVLQTAENLIPLDTLNLPRHNWRLSGYLQGAVNK